jgi:hypothetical protein
MHLDKLPWRIKIQEKNEQFFKLHGRDPTWKEYQVLHNFVETDYSVKQCEWKMLDYANPAWTPALAFGGSN